MYLDWETYSELSADPIAEADFASAEAWAEAVLDNWTLNRLHVVDWSNFEGKVALVMTHLVDKQAAILQADESSELTMFSNGVDTYHFGETKSNTVLNAVEAYARDLLPVELMSACVYYNGAH